MPSTWRYLTRRHRKSGPLKRPVMSHTNCGSTCRRKGTVLSHMSMAVRIGRRLWFWQKAVVHGPKPHATRTVSFHLLLASSTRPRTLYYWSI